MGGKKDQPLLSALRSLSLCWGKKKGVVRPGLGFPKKSRITGIQSSQCHQPQFHSLKKKRENKTQNPLTHVMRNATTSFSHPV